MASKDVPILEVGDLYRVLHSPTEFTYVLVTSVDPIEYREESTLKRLTPGERYVGVLQRHVWDDAISTWYLVCRQCGEAFDSMKTARGHIPQECGSWQGFDLLPESEAL